MTPGGRLCASPALTISLRWDFSRAFHFLQPVYFHRLRLSVLYCSHCSALPTSVIITRTNGEVFIYSKRFFVGQEKPAFILLRFAVTDFVLQLRCARPTLSPHRRKPLVSPLPVRPHNSHHRHDLILGGVFSRASVKLCASRFGW